MGNYQLIKKAPCGPKELVLLEQSVADKTLRVTLLNLVTNQALVYKFEADNVAAAYEFYGRFLGENVVFLRKAA